MVDDSAAMKEKWFGIQSTDSAQTVFYDQTGNMLMVREWGFKLFNPTNNPTSNLLRPVPNITMYNQHRVAGYALYKAWFSALRYTSLCHPNGADVLSGNVCSNPRNIDGSKDMLLAALRSSIPSKLQPLGEKTWVDTVTRSVFGPQASLSDPPQYIGVKFDYPVTANNSLWDLISSTAHGPCSWPTIECGSDCKHGENSNITGM